MQKQYLAEIMRVCPEAILLVASNPVDIMTQITTGISRVYRRTG